jgi:hypothetical protein
MPTVGGQQDLPGGGPSRTAPLSAMSSRCVIVQAKQRLASDAIHRHMRDAPAVLAAGVMGRAFWAIRVHRGCARSADMGRRSAPTTSFGMAG